MEGRGEKNESMNSNNEKGMKSMEKENYKKE